MIWGGGIGRGGRDERENAEISASFASDGWAVPREDSNLHTTIKRKVRLITSVDRDHQK